MIYERKRKEINAFAGDEAKDTKGGEKLFRFFISLRCSPVWNGNWTKKFYQILSFNWIGIKINNKEQEWQTTIEELKKCKMEIGAFGVWVDHEIWGYHLPLWILIRFPKLFQKYKIVTNEYWSPSQLKTTPGVINLFQNSCSKKLPQLLSCYNPGRQASFIFVLPPVCSTFVDMSSKKKFPSNRFRKSNALFSFGVSLLAVYLNPSVLKCHLEILTGLESEMGKGQSAL